jgi:hypothetical protein
LIDVERFDSERNNHASVTLCPFFIMCKTQFYGGILQCH